MYTVISTMILAQVSVLMDGQEKNVINYVYLVALYASNIIPAHVVNAA